MQLATRGRFLATGAAAATFAIVTAPARAAEFEFRSGSQYSADHPTSVRLTQMYNEIEKATNGRLKVQFFPNSALGGDTAMFSQLRVGAIQFLIVGAPLSSVVPANDITSLGYAFKGPEEALHVMDGALGDFLRAETAAKGMHQLRATWNSGMRQLGSNSRAIMGPDDLKGFKIKVVGKMSITLFKALDSQPVELGLSETYTGLQTHLLDGVDTPLTTIQTSRLYEVSKSVGIDNHSWSGLYLIANGDVWKTLPPDIQATVERLNTKYALLERRDSIQLDNVLADKLKRLGLQMNRLDQAPFRARLRGYFDTWASAFGPKEWGLLESSLGRKLV